MQDPAMASAQTPNDAPGGDVFRLAMASSASGMGILDLDGRWLEANPAFERLLGRPAARLAGERITAAVAARDTEAVGDALVAGAGTSQWLPVAFVHADGHEVRVRIEVAPMRDASGGVHSLVVHAFTACDAPGAGADVGADADADAVLRRLAETETALAALNRLQASLAHGVSHDLRAPLRAIDSFSALLASHLGGDLDDTAHDYIERIRAASARMAILIDSLLELSRAQRVELHPAPVDLGLLADWAHAELADADPGRDARVDVQPDLQVLGDERLLRQLVGQLLDNAWKFSRDRDRVRVEIDGERRGDRLVVRVRDHGCGFDMRYADKLFEPFQRLHGPEQAAGNGIGLSIVRCIAERHRGRVWAQSEPGAGSTFFVELPAVPDTGNGA
jgi:PAS domain S-box-containing protein